MVFQWFEDELNSVALQCRFSQNIFGMGGSKGQQN